MALSKEQVRHIASLARIGLTDQEVEKFSVQLSDIFNYVGLLSELNTDAVLPTAQVTGLMNVSRDDVIEKSFGSREELLACSPLEIDQHQIKVPSVFE